MTPRTKKPRPSIFPAYAPPEQSDLSPDEQLAHIGGYIRAIATRLAQIGTLLVAIGGGTAIAARPSTPPTVNDSAALARIKALEDTSVVRGKQVSNLEVSIRSVLYISCETLSKVQPTQSIPPEVCRR